MPRSGPGHTEQHSFIAYALEALIHTDWGFFIIIANAWKNGEMTPAVE